MQQTQVQLPIPPRRKRRRLSRTTMIVIGCIILIAIGVFWALVSLGKLPSLLGITPANLAILATIVVAVLGLIFMYIPIIPADETSEQSATPATQNIIIQVPPYQTVPSSPQPTIPDIYRGIASLPPSTSLTSIQQREDVVRMWPIGVILTKRYVVPYN